MCRPFTTALGWRVGRTEAVCIVANVGRILVVGDRVSLVEGRSRRATRAPSASRLRCGEERVSPPCPPPSPNRHAEPRLGPPIVLSRWLWGAAPLYRNVYLRLLPEDASRWTGAPSLPWGRRAAPSQLSAGGSVLRLLPHRLGAGGRDRPPLAVASAPHRQPLLLCSAPHCRPAHCPAHCPAYCSAPRRRRPRRRRRRRWCRMLRRSPPAATTQ